MTEIVVNPPKFNLLEDTKSFLDDLSDIQIIAISKQTTRPGEYYFAPRILMNKHRRVMGFTEMSEVHRYCKYLIEIGAVKNAVLENPS